jgi:CheY-like chemotaxis protein
MPHLTGDKLAEKILDIRPDVPIVLCTGYSETLVEDKVKSLGIRELVSKPLVIGELASTVRRALG